LSPVVANSAKRGIDPPLRGRESGLVAGNGGVVARRRKRGGAGRGGKRGEAALREGGGATGLSCIWEGGSGNRARSANGELS